MNNGSKPIDNYFEYLPTNYAPNSLAEVVLGVGAAGSSIVAIERLLNGDSAGIWILNTVVCTGGAIYAHRREAEITRKQYGQTEDFDASVTIDEKLEAYDGETVDDELEIDRRLRELHKEVGMEYNPDEYGITIEIETDPDGEIEIDSPDQI